MIANTKTTSILRVVSRWFVGLVFLFSSFTKGVDPMGTAFKVEEYMTAWNFFGVSFSGLTGLAPLLAMTLITVEFVIGVMLLTGSFRKLTSWILLLMMAFFTFTTLYDAITNKVSDCGCFGDAIKLTNWQTFWKNIILDIPTLFIFFTRGWKHRLKLERDVLVMLASAAAMTVFGLYNIHNEPVVDFRPWKVGNTMIDNIEEGLETINMVTYKNKEDGEYRTLNSKELMQCFAEDPEWGDKWEWIGTQTISPYDVHADGFFIMDADGQDMTFDLIAATEGPVLLTTIHHVDKVNSRGVEAIASMKQMAADKGIRFAVVSSSSEPELQRFLYLNKLMDVDYYFGDEKALETMLRNNPGFIVMQNAVVRGKWSYRNVEKIKEFPFEENN